MPGDREGSLTGSAGANLTTRSALAELCTSRGPGRRVRGAALGWVLTYAATGLTTSDRAHVLHTGMHPPPTSTTCSPGPVPHITQAAPGG